MSNMLRSSYKIAAEKIVNLSRSGAIDDRVSNNNLAEILKDCAEEYDKEAKSIEDRNEMNAAMIELFQRTIVRESTAIRKFNATPKDIYDRLLRTADRQPQSHTQGISSLAFAFAVILALSLHRGDTSQSNLEDNQTPCFDLSPLYGANETETSRIRMKDGSGMLWPDSFTEERVAMIPDSVPALLVLWNRYHNYVAKQLLWHNEGDKWSRLSLEQRDNEIFKVARSITCIHFINVVREDFVKGLIGMPIVGPSAHVDILYDIKDNPNPKGGYLALVKPYFLYSFSSFAPPSFGSPIHERESLDPDIKRRNYGKLCRNEHGRFEDNDLAGLLFHAIETKAGSPGGGRVPSWAREQEILKLEEARKANVCTLNEFRRHLGLKPFKSFKEWNPDPELAKIASDLYKSEIDNLELYPGLLFESSSGSGFGFGYTMTWGLLADIIGRIRSDPMFTSQLNERVLTKWGYKDSIMSVDDAKESNLCFHSTGGSLGGILPKLLQRTLPHNCPYDNIYCLFPFVVPQKSAEYVGRLSEPARKKYTVDRPEPVKIKVLSTLKAISEALNDTQTFPSPYTHDLIYLTGGYGHFLGFDDSALHDYDLMLTLFSLMPDTGAVERIGSDFARRAQECFISRRGSLSVGNALNIDIVKDVIDATCVRWVCETILNIHFKDADSDTIKARNESRSREMKERTDFACCYTYIFRNAEPEFGWNARERALAASTRLSQHIRDHIHKYDQPPEKPRQSIFHLGLGDQYFNGKKVLQRHAYTFIDRVLKACQLRPLKQLATRNRGHLAELREKALKRTIHHAARISSAVAPSLGKEELNIFNRLITFQNDFDVSDHRIKHKAWQDIEENRVIANVIGLAVVISVHFSKACAQAVDFYLDDRYTEERKALVELCQDDNSSNEKIMEYVWEALRIKQRFGLWRDVALPSVHTKKIIEQGSNYPDIIIEQGDRVFADFTSAHNDPLQVPEPEKVKLDRKLNSLLGLGMHKCPARAFIQQTMSQIIRVIFKQEGLVRKEGKEGNLRSTTLHPHVEPWHSEVYLDEDDSFSYYPKKMVLQFKRSEPNIRWEYNFEDEYGGVDRTIDNGRIALFIVFLYLILHFFVSSYLLSPSTSSGRTNLDFERPLTTFQDRHMDTTCEAQNLLLLPPPEECPATAAIAETIMPSVSPRKPSLLELAKIMEPPSDLA